MSKAKATLNTHTKNNKLIEGFNNQFGREYFLTQEEKQRSSLLITPIFYKSVEESIYSYEATYDNKKITRHFCFVLFNNDTDVRVFFFGKKMMDHLMLDDYRALKDMHQIEYTLVRPWANSRKIPHVSIRTIDATFKNDNPYITQRWIEERLTFVPFTLKQLHNVLINKQVDANYITFNSAKDFFSM